jgi:hypothetical protein
MSKYTKQDVIDGRKCGLKYFDKAVEIIGRQQLIDKAIEINKKSPDVWKAGWSNFDWAIGNAVIEIINSKGDISQSWNLDEALNDNEIQHIASVCCFSLPFTPSWPRKTTAIKSNGKISTNQIKKLISSWLKDSNEFRNYFNNWFGDFGPNEDELKEYSKRLKCQPNETAIVNATIDYVSDGKNWKRYEKCKYDPLNDQMNKNLVINGWVNTKVIGWESISFQKDNKNYTLRVFASKSDNFEGRDLFVISNETDTEVLSWAIWDY